MSADLLEAAPPSVISPSVDVGFGSTECSGCESRLRLAGPTDVVVCPHCDVPCVLPKCELCVELGVDNSPKESPE